MGHDLKPPITETLESIRDEFRHDPETGELFRRVGTLSVNKDGYHRLTVSVAGHARLVSHVVWFLEHGHWPLTLLDHIDNDSTNNRPANLRETTHSRNLTNSKQRNRPLPIGVYVKGGHFQARISSNGALRTLGTFNTPGEAEQTFITEHLRRFGRHSRYFNGPRKQRFGS